jgi:uridine kinase
MESVCVVGIAGGTASGKTTLARTLLAHLGTDIACIVELDSYYRSHDDISYEQRTHINYDHPEAFEFDLLLAHVEELKKGLSVRVPVYNFAEHNRDSVIVRVVQPRPVVLIEGILTLTHEPLRRVLDYSVFVDAPTQVRFDRRLARDVRERGRTPESVAAQWTQTVHPMHEEFCEPTKLLAGRIIDGVTFGDEEVHSIGAEVSRLALGVGAF